MITITEKRYLSVTVFLSPYDPVPATLLKIDQDLRGRGLYCKNFQRNYLIIISCFILLKNMKNFLAKNF